MRRFLRQARMCVGPKGGGASCGEGLSSPCTQHVRAARICTGPQIRLSSTRAHRTESPAVSNFCLTERHDQPWRIGWRTGWCFGGTGVFDRTSVSRFNQVGPRDFPHLLEWHASHCICLADTCSTPHVRKLLRLLAADLAIEAETRRRHLQERDLAMLTPHEARPPSWPLPARGDQPARLGLAALSPPSSRT